MQRQNVTKEMAIQAIRETGRDAYIWYDNPRDGWHWDRPGSLYLGFKNDGTRTTKLTLIKGAK